MVDALNYIYLIFDKFVQCVFVDLELYSGVTLGWIAVSVLLFSLMIRSILNLPKSMNNFSSIRRKDNGR